MTPLVLTSFTLLFMSFDPIILIPPTHEQSLFSIHVSAQLAEEFMVYLKKRGIEPWRPPVPLEKHGEEDKNERVVQIEIDAKARQRDLETLIKDFKKQGATKPS